MASDIKTLHFCCSSAALVFDTTSPSAKARVIDTGLLGRPSEPQLASLRHGSSTPRQDLCRPPSLLEAGTGRKYHCP